MNMDYHKILHILTINNYDKVDFDSKLVMLLHQVSAQLPEKEEEDLKQHIEMSCCRAKDDSIRRKYLETVFHILYALQIKILSISDTFMSVNEYRVVKIAIEHIISIGIMPCLLPGIGVGLNKLCTHAGKIPQESLTDFQKYDRLVSVVGHLTNFYDEISLRPAILTQLGPILSALFQLGHAPLIKPTDVNPDSPNSQMTNIRYTQLLTEQTEFKNKLHHLIRNCQLSYIMKELMILSGIEGAPNWLKRATRSYLVDAIIEPTGVMSLINATCEETLDIGRDWNKLKIISKVIATPHLKDSEQYFNAVCAQLLNILTSKNIKHATNIASNCITSLYKLKPKICVEKIFHVIAAPLRIKGKDYITYAEDSIIKSEVEISECIENLVKCFIPKDGKIQTLPHVLLKEISLPLFVIQCKIYNSATLIKSKVRELLIYLLTNEKQCDHLLSAFLDHELQPEYFGERIYCEFGSHGGVEIRKKTENLDFVHRWSEYGITLLNLVKPDENLSLNVLNYLFKWFLMLRENKSKLKEEYTNDQYDYLMKIVGQQIAAGAIISELGSKSSIQQSLFKSPEPLLSFVTALYPKQIDHATNLPEDYETLYTGLMLIKMIVIEGGNSIDWTPFNEFSRYLQEKLKYEFPSDLLNLTREVINTIKTRGLRPRFQDLTITGKNEENFEKALRDLADPLLPVRAHGLMTMTKLIESSDPIAIAKKDLILCFLQENLKDDDSFVYLVAINGLCAMAVLFPQQVIELLVQEFINMPQRNKTDEIAPENRAKLGEILVKTTRALGEMVSQYKTILINGFLCGVRDFDPIVRTSSLSCLGELCKVLSFRLGSTITEVLYCVGCVIQTDKSHECRRAAVLVITLLIRGIGKDALAYLANELLPVYRGLKYLRDNDEDDVLRLHAQLALEEIDDIVQSVLFTKPTLEKNIFLLA